MWPVLATFLLVAHIAAVAFPPALPQDDNEAALDAAAELTENFDPAKGDPYHNISCVGSHYDLELPLQQGWNPNERSMQELCAKPQYNGGPPGQHVGGWCNHNEVVFDDSAIAQINTQLANPRVYLGCRYRCYCNHQIHVENRRIQPKPSESQQALQLLKDDRSSSLTYEVRLDIQNDFTMPRDYNQGSLDYDEVDVLRIAQFPEVRHTESLEQPHYDYVSEDEGNKITCTGSLPTFVLPPPYSVLPPHSDFQTNQQLCATQLNGGLLGANAGGYCHRSDGLDPTGSFPAQTVWFSDEMTPRLDWTWDGGLFFASASIRLHCYLNCKCRNGETDKTPTAGVWRFVDGHQLTLRGNGRVDLEESGNPPSQGSGRPGGGGDSSSSSGGNEPDPKRIKMTVLPAQGDGGNVSSAPRNDSAGPSGSSDPRGGINPLRPQAWPTSMLGPVPSAPPNATQIVKPGSAGSGTGKGKGKGRKTTPATPGDLTVCGNRCSGVADCASGNGTDHACTCAYPNANDAKWLGLDPVMPVSVCLVLMNMAFGHAKMAGGGDLNGRDVGVGSSGVQGGGGGGGSEPGPYVDRDGAEWLCRCNATFAHNRCCGSRDGMVWLG